MKCAQPVAHVHVNKHCTLPALQVEDLPLLCRTWQTILSPSPDAGHSTLEVWAPTTKYQLHGITRANVLRLCADNDIPYMEKDFSLTSVYSAEEAFVTGTFAGLIPVTQVAVLSWLCTCMAPLRKLSVAKVLHARLRSVLALHRFPEVEADGLAIQICDAPCLLLAG
jgi:Amino-transferase class IV